MKNTVRITALIIISCIIIFGCSESQPPKAPDEVKLQLKWHHQAQFAGFYMAQEKGYYAAENIKVTFLEGGPNVDIAEKLISGRAGFGILAPEVILINRSRGVPFTSIATIFRRSPTVFVAKYDSGIIRPSDFTGKTVSVSSIGFSESETQFKAMMKKLGVDLSKVKVTLHDATYENIYSNEADVSAAYSISGVIRMRKKGLKLNLIWPEDYGINFYSDTLVTTEKLISENPDLVKRFTRASLKGWQDSIGDYRQAVNVTLKYAGDKDSDIQTAMMEAMLPLVHTGEDHIGWMKPDVWNEMYETLLEQGLLEKPFDINKGYTIKFIEEIYGGKVR